MEKKSLPGLMECKEKKISGQLVFNSRSSNKDIGEGWIFLNSILLSQILFFLQLMIEMQSNSAMLHRFKEMKSQQCLDFPLMSA